jgi:predicted DNA-binding protein (UPF0251 family)
MRKTAFMEWLDKKIAASPTMQAEVDAALADLRLEEELVRLRESRGVSQVELATRMGVSQPSVARLESGRMRNVELRTVQRFVTALGGKLIVRVESSAGRRQAVALRSTRAKPKRAKAP